MRKGTLVAVFPAILILAAGCTKTAKDEMITAPLPRVTVHTVSEKEFSPDITSFGSIVYTRKNDISSSVEGILQEIPYREGAPVRKGMRLARMENIQLTINHEQAKASYSSAKAATHLAEEEYKDYRMQLESNFLSIEKADLELSITTQQLELLRKELRDSETLYSVGGITGEDLLSARFSLTAAETEYAKLIKEKEIMCIGLRNSDITASGLVVPENAGERKALLIDLNSKTKLAEVELTRKQEETAKTQMLSAQALLDELTIVSPVTGIVGAVYLEVGERVESGAKILTIIDASTAWAVFPVNEKDLGRIRKGMSAKLHIEALGENPIEAVIDVISPTVDPQSGSVTIKALLQNPDNSCKPGMFVRVAVPTDIPTKRIFIPQTCLAQQEQNAGVVITVRNNRVFQRKIQLGIESQDEIEVVSGLQNGEQLVIEPTPLLKEGDRVEIYENQ